MRDSVMRASYQNIPHLTTSSTQKSYKLLNKVVPFMKHLDRTHSQQLKKSNVYELATTIYKKQIKDSELSPTRKLRKSLVIKNPEQLESPHLKKRNVMEQFIQKIGYNKTISNLNEKTLKVPEYTQILINLGQQKQSLQSQIQLRKNEIARQKNLKYKLSLACRKNLNKIQTLNDNINKLHIQMDKIFILGNETTDEINLLIKELKDLNSKNESTLKSIREERDNIKQLQEFNKDAKYGIITTDKELNEVKLNLTIGLKNLQNNANYIRYLQSEKAEMLLHINRQYQEKWNNKNK